MRALPGLLLASAVWVAGPGCTDDGDRADAGDPRIWRRAPALPVALSSNAVAAFEADGACTLYTAMGVDQSLSPAGFANRAYQWHVGTERWLALPNVPSDAGRIATSAVVLDGRVFVLGGCSILEDGTQLSFGAVHAFDIGAATWSTLDPLPVHVSGAVTLAWRDRWIVTVGGWSNTEPVAAVQLYDTDTATWAAGTPFPGTPVFGHAAVLLGDELLVVDGVTLGADGYQVVHQAWLATLDPDDPTAMVWEDLGEHPGPARCHAAAGFAWGQLAWIHGGADEPYDFDGRSQATGAPISPLSTTLVFDFGTRAFAMHDKIKPVPTMDHRGLASCAGRMYTVGGLVEGPEVTSEVWVYTY